MSNIVFTGGGTLGHVIPNVYLIEDLQAKTNKPTIHYIGSAGIEKERVKSISIYHEIPAVKLVRGKIFTNFKIPFVLISSIIKSTKILKEIKPDVVFSKGGYVSLPVCIAAKMLKIPIIAHESDYSFGLANKIILKLCNTMCVNFKNLQSKNNKIVYTGPIFSSSFEKGANTNLNINLDKSKPTLLVVGGSLGSVKLNEMIFAVLRELLHDFNIIHITGKGNKKQNSFENYTAFELTNDMSTLYNLADFVLGRSGAGVTAECYFKRLPMLLVPLENKASRGDQVLNANYYKSLGVADVLKEEELTPTKLKTKIQTFYSNIKTYQTAYKTQNPTNGKDKILNLILKYIK